MLTRHVLAARKQFVSMKDHTSNALLNLIPIQIVVANVRYGS